MATGYEVQMYHDITRTAKAAERIADALEKIAAALSPQDTETAEDGS